MRTDQMARAAGKLAGRYLPKAKAAAGAAINSQSAKAAAQWVPTAKQSGQFVKHVVPAAVKPLHALWHQVLGFIFLVFAGLCAWKVWRSHDNIDLPMLAIAVVFIVIMAGYGLSSILKSQRISRS